METIPPLILKEKIPRLTLTGEASMKRLKYWKYIYLTICESFHHSSFKNNPEKCRSLLSPLVDR